MYVPKHFAENDRETLYGWIRANGFAVLVNQMDDVPYASHIPLHLDVTGTDVRLLGHVARANPHARTFDGETPALAIFSGPHDYVSPNWYVSRNMVPTWNYIAIHAYGQPATIAEGTATHRVLRMLATDYETDATGNWSPDDLDETVMEKMARAVVAFEMPIERLEGKVKVSQNRKPEDAAGVVAALRSLGGENRTAVADEMIRRGKPS